MYVPQLAPVKPLGILESLNSGGMSADTLNQILQNRTLQTNLQTLGAQNQANLQGKQLENQTAQVNLNTLDQMNRARISQINSLAGYQSAETDVLKAQQPYVGDTAAANLRGKQLQNQFYPNTVAINTLNAAAKAAPYLGPLANFQKAPDSIKEGAAAALTAGQGSYLNYPTGSAISQPAFQSLMQTALNGFGGAGLPGPRPTNAQIGNQPLTINPAVAQQAAPALARVLGQNSVQVGAPVQQQAPGFSLSPTQMAAAQQQAVQVQPTQDFSQPISAPQQNVNPQTGLPTDMGANNAILAQRQLKSTPTEVQKQLPEVSALQSEVADMEKRAIPAMIKYSGVNGYKQYVLDAKDFALGKPVPPEFLDLNSFRQTQHPLLANQLRRAQGDSVRQATMHLLNAATDPNEGLASLRKEQIASNFEQLRAFVNNLKSNLTNYAGTPLNQVPAGTAQGFDPQEFYSKLPGDSAAAQQVYNSLPLTQKILVSNYHRRIAGAKP